MNGKQSERMKECSYKNLSSSTDIESVMKDLMSVVHKKKKTQLQNCKKTTIFLHNVTKMKKKNQNIFSNNIFLRTVE